MGYRLLPELLRRDQRRLMAYPLVGAEPFSPSRCSFSVSGHAQACSSSRALLKSLIARQLHRKRTRHRGLMTEAESCVFGWSPNQAL